MKFIDKTLKRQEGEQIITEFLDCFHHRTGAYPHDMYNALCAEIDDAHNHIKFRTRLESVLMTEQNGLCCYCLRKLSECRKVTIEHIMPNHAKDKAELDEYRTKKTELDGLPHTDDFKAQSPIVYPPHPHSIAYQNMVLSCDGDLFKEHNTKSVCCNLKRAHRLLPPFVLYNDIEQRFNYTVDGMAEWTDDPEPPESRNNAMRILGLNNYVLRMVRRIWFFCIDHNLNPHTDRKDDVINTMMGYLASQSITENEINMLLNFKKDKYWKLLLEYDAFATIPHS